MHVAIYQIDMDRDEKRVKFASLDRLDKYQGSGKVNPSIYNKVYEGNVEAKNLEDVFYIFNMNRPQDFKGHSLSVSDVVETTDETTGAKKWYYCDDFGFPEIGFDASAVL